MPTKKTTSQRKSLGLGAALLAVLAILILTLAPANTQVLTNVQPALLAMADTQPDATVRVIVQKASTDGELELLIMELEGTIIKDLNSINALAVKLPAKAIPTLARSDSVAQISLDGEMMSTSILTETVRDEFSSTLFSNNDGSQYWAGYWIENGENDGPGSGDLSIGSGYLRIRDDDRSLHRAIDLSNATSAILSFDYRRYKLDKTSDYIAIEVSANGGASWTELDRFDGSDNDKSFQPASYDIIDFASADSLIRFSTSSSLGSSDYLFVDNLQIEFSVNFDDTGGLPPSTASVRDEFNTVSLGGNDGVDTWLTDWVEDDEGVWDEGVEPYQNPAEGYVQVVDGELRIHNSDEYIHYPGVSRTVDLSGVINATLSFDFRTTEVHTYDGIAVEVSSDGGQNFIQLEAIENLSGANSGSRSYDITRFATNQTTIRIRVAYFYGFPNQYFYLDNVEIGYTYDGDMPIYGSGQTVADDFNAYPYDFSVNSGSQNWLNSWQEINDDGLPMSGDAHFTNYLGGYRVFTFWTDDQEPWQAERGIWRTADLSGGNWAELSFLYKRGSMELQDYLAAEVSTDGGATWTEAGRVYGKGINGVTSMDDGWLLAAFEISDYISSNTAVRLITNFYENDTYNVNDAYDNVYVDDIQILFNKPPENQQSNTYLATLNMKPVWGMGLDGSGITVAVVDSGVALDYDFSSVAGQPVADRIVAQVGFNANSNIVYDNFGHGTHVAGIIGSNGTGSSYMDQPGLYQGIAPGVNLIGLKVSDDYGMAYESDTVDALQWIFDHKDEYNIRVVNLSLNSTLEQSYNESALDAAVELLWLNGIVVVASSGNELGPHNTANAAPANDPFIITVGASEENYTTNREDDWVAAFTAHGITQDGYQKPEVIAPGKDIVSVLAASSWWQNDYPERYVDGGYFRISGTSMAAPMVSGAVALLLQAEPNLTPDQVKYRLMNTGSSLYFNGEYPYLDVYDLITTPTIASANADVIPHEMLAKMALIAYWASENGDENIDWANVDWDAVNWDAVDWNSVNWGSVNWGSVNWGSVNWGSVNWGSVNWGSVNWGSVNWGSVNWGSVNWGSVNWGSVSWDD